MNDVVIILEPLPTKSDILPDGIKKKQWRLTYSYSNGPIPKRLKVKR